MACGALKLHELFKPQVISCGRKVGVSNVINRAQNVDLMPAVNVVGQRCVGPATLSKSTEYLHKGRLGCWWRHFENARYLWPAQQSMERCIQRGNCNGTFDRWLPEVGSATLDDAGGPGVSGTSSRSGAPRFRLASRALPRPSVGLTEVQLLMACRAFDIDASQCAVSPPEQVVCSCVRGGVRDK
jgi:hypothetical protein